MGTLMTGVSSIGLVGLTAAATGSCLDLGMNSHRKK